MSPQGVMDLLVVHSPHSVAQNPGNTQTTITIHQLSSPHMHNPRNGIPRLCHAIPWAFPLPSKAPLHSVGQEYHNWGLQELSTAPRVLTTFFSRLLSHFLHRQVNYRNTTYITCLQPSFLA
jgi:hypothetical protein